MVASYQEEAGDLLQPSRQEKFESTTSFKDKRNKSVKFLDQKLTREERKRQVITQVQAFALPAASCEAQRCTRQYRSKD